MGFEALGCPLPSKQLTNYVDILGGSAWMDDWWMLSHRTKHGVITISPHRLAINLGTQSWVLLCKSGVVKAVCRPQNRKGQLEWVLARMGASLQLPSRPLLSLPCHHCLPSPHLPNHPCHHPRPPFFPVVHPSRGVQLPLVVHQPQSLPSRPLVISSTLNKG